jgi:hypothetical protein
MEISKKSIEWVNRPGFLWAGYDHAGPPSRSIFFRLLELLQNDDMKVMRNMMGIFHGE